jgi:RNase P subunit RPR2
MKTEQEISICDGCGWKKKITFIDEFGKGFCKKCMQDSLIKVLGEE